jgi:hypothetical protein
MSIFDPPLVAAFDGARSMILERFVGFCIGCLADEEVAEQREVGRVAD